MAEHDRVRRGLPIAVRRIVVEAVTDITPAMRRITFSGDDLFGVADRPKLCSPGFDDHVKLVLPGPVGDGLGEHTATGFEWRPGVLERTRDYSIRRWDEASGRLDIDVVRHPGGLASSWAEQAGPGDVIHCAGPRGSAGPLPDADWHLLVGDETALPAIARWLEEADIDQVTHVFIEVPSAADMQHLDTLADAHITWIVRPDHIAAGKSPLLMEALRGFSTPIGSGYAWCAGEALTLKPIRQLLRKRLAADRVEAHGYWRSGDEAEGTESSEEILPAA